MEEKYNFFLSQTYPVVNCLLYPEEQIKLKLSYSTSILDTNSNLFIENAIVEIFENDSSLGLLNYVRDGQYELNYFPNESKIYKIYITHSSFSDTIFAEDIVPEKTSILSADYLYPVGQDAYATEHGKVSLTFSDNGTNRNYYEIFFLQKTTNGFSYIYNFKVNSSIINVNSDDGVTSRSIFFSDEFFNGEEIKLEIITDGSEAPYIVLRNISKSYYEYRNTLYTHLNNQNNSRNDIYALFKGDPINMYSNVNNGLGVFVAYNQDMKKCTFISNSK